MTTRPPAKDGPTTAAASRSTPVSPITLRARHQWSLARGTALYYTRQRRWAALVRALFATTVLCHESELCQDCGRRYNDFCWWSPAPLWQELNGRYGGTLCPRCFERKAKTAGYRLSWTPMVVHHDGTATTNHWLNPVRDRLLMGEPDPYYFDGELVNEPQGDWGKIGAALGWDLPSEYPPENVRR